MNSGSILSFEKELSMRHLDGTYEPDRPRESRSRFAAIALFWGVLLALGGAAALVGAEIVAEVLSAPADRP
jgi:hypothetical protein